MVVVSSAYFLNKMALGPWVAHLRMTVFKGLRKHSSTQSQGAQWLSGRVLDSRPKGRGFEPHRRHCVVSLSKNSNPSLVLVQPRKTRPFITERLLMGCKESNQTNKSTQSQAVNLIFRQNFPI